MADAKVRVEFDAEAVKNAVRRGGVKSLRQAGAYVRKAARHAVKKSSSASAAGTPPHTRRTPAAVCSRIRSFSGSKSSAWRS